MERKRHDVSRETSGGQPNTSLKRRLSLEATPAPFNSSYSGFHESPGNPHYIDKPETTAYSGNREIPLYGHTTGCVVELIKKVFVKDTTEAALQKPSGDASENPVQCIHMLLR